MPTYIAIIISVGIIAYIIFYYSYDPINILKRKIGKRSNVPILSIVKLMKGEQLSFNFIRGGEGGIIQAGFFHNKKATLINDTTKPLLDKIGFKYEDLTKRIPLNEFYGIKVKKIFRVQRLKKMDVYSIESVDGKCYSYLECKNWNDSLYLKYLK